MTTTTKKDSTEDTKVEAPAKSKRGGSSGSSPAGSEGGYAAVFRHWAFEAVETGPVTVDPKTLVNICDVRDTGGGKKLDDFLIQTKDGIDTPIRVTRAKFLGETGEYMMAPEPTAKVKLKHGETYTIIVYGRRRTRAALHHGFKALHATMARYASWHEFVAAAFKENVAREDMSQWDYAVFIKNQKDGGATNDQIAATVAPKVSSSNISHILGVFDLPTPVQKLYREGKIATTEVRALRPLRNVEGGDDIAVKLAMTAVEKEWTEERLKEAVKAVTAPADNAGKGGKKKKIRVKRIDYSKAKVTPVKVDVVRVVLSNLDAGVQIARQKFNALPEDATVEQRVRAATAKGKAEGRLEAMLQGFGLAELPESLTVDHTPEEPAEG